MSVQYLADSKPLIMRQELEAFSKNAFAWFLNELADAPFCHVESTGRAKGKWVYVRDGCPFRLSTEPGIYVVYPKNELNPVYVGEGGNLRQRVEYHFSESESAKKSSTLKKALRKKGYSSHVATHELVRFKHVIVPFGRKEIEEFLHAKYEINTKEKRC